ncbi:hypothetical protein BHE74_00026466 [Ensete ventricosum]|nr:hypothetical protein BHE74_00026466 [Ensete ventricosum]
MLYVRLEVSTFVESWKPRQPTGDSVIITDSIVLRSAFQLGKHLAASAGNPAAFIQSPSRLRFLVTETHAKPIPGSESIPRRPALTSGSICEIEVSLPFPDSKRTSSNLVLGIGRTMVLWVFGYGSLVCNPGFEFDEKIIGFIKDYRRVFDLGKVFVDDRQLSRIPSLKEYTDRYALGTPEFPARTCTLEPEKGAICWGVAYCVKGGAEKERAAVKEGKTSDPAATGVIVIRSCLTLSSIAGHEDDFVIELANKVRKALGGLKQKASVVHLPLQPQASFLHIKSLPEASVGVDS